VTSPVLAFAVIIAVPTAFAVTTPALVIDAMVLLLVDHVTGLSALRETVSLTYRVLLAGSIIIVSSVVAKAIDAKSRQITDAKITTTSNTDVSFLFISISSKF